MLEEIRARNEATIDAVHSSARQLGGQIDELARRVSLLELAVQRNGADIRQNTSDIRRNGEDIRLLQAAVERIEVKLDGKADRAVVEDLARRLAILEAASR